MPSLHDIAREHRGMSAQAGAYTREESYGLHDLDFDWERGGGCTIKINIPHTIYPI